MCFPLQDKELRSPCENEPDDDDRRLGDDINGADDLVKQRGLADSLNIKPNKKDHQDDRLGRPYRIDLPKDPDVQGKIPRPIVEKARAKIKTVKINVMEVRGMMVAGLRVS